MARQVELEFRRGAPQWLTRGQHLLVAVSGGGDSVALLHLLARQARQWQLTLTVAHLDHGLRRGSVGDRRFVERVARGLGLSCRSERLDVAALRRRDESPEEGARRVRRTFLIGCARAAGAERIATGHTLDDQAETLLLRLVRGAGPRALTGMATAGPGPFVRPLLAIERAALRAYLDQQGHAFREDITNRDLRFDRNRVRRLVLPYLAATLNPHAAQQLVRSAGRLRDDALHLDGLAERRLGELSERRGGDLVLDAAAVAGEPPVIARRLARLALERAGADPRRVSARHVAALIGLAAGLPGRGVDLPGRLRARREAQRLVIG